MKKGISNLTSCKHDKTVLMYGIDGLHIAGSLTYVNGTVERCENCGYRLDWKLPLKPTKEEIELYKLLPEKNWNLT